MGHGAPREKAEPAGASYAMSVGGVEMPITAPRYHFGRSDECELVVPSALASRVHACLRIVRGRPLLQDLGSANGTYVNDERIGDPVELCDGDRIRIGAAEFVFKAKHERRTRSGERPTLGVRRARDSQMPLSERETPLSQRATPTSERSTPPPSRPPPLVTRSGEVTIPTELRADPIGHLGRLADKMLALGRADSAERLLADHVDGVLKGARAGRLVSEQLVRVLGEYSVKLARATGDGRWIDRLLELHTLRRLPLSEDLVHQLMVALPVIHGVSAPIVSGYRGSMRAQIDALTPHERAAHRRFERLTLPLR